MRIRYCFLLILLSFSLSACDTSEENGSIPKQHLYLEQKPPGLTPEVFAPKIVTTKNAEFFGSFTPDLKEFYFKRKGGEFKESTLVVIEYKNEQWIESVVYPPKASVGEPSLSPDGKTIHLGSRYIKRNGSGWSNVKSLKEPFKHVPIMRLTSSKNKSFVFDERDSIGTIWYSRFIEGKHEKPIAFSKEINSGKWTSHPFIAPDESYLIWDSERTGGYGNSDLYISYREDNGSWGPAINLGAGINTKYEEIFGSVTPDGKYLFFHRYLGKGEVNIFWVDTKAIKSFNSESR